MLWVVGRLSVCVCASASGVWLAAWVALVLCAVGSCRLALSFWFCPPGLVSSLFLRSCDDPRTDLQPGITFTPEVVVYRMLWPWYWLVVRCMVSIVFLSFSLFVFPSRLLPTFSIHPVRTRWKYHLCSSSTISLHSWNLVPTIF